MKKKVRFLKQRISYIIDEINNILESKETIDDVNEIEILFSMPSGYVANSYSQVKSVEYVNEEETGVYSEMQILIINDNENVIGCIYINDEQEAEMEVTNFPMNEFEDTFQRVIQLKFLR